MGFYLGYKLVKNEVTVTLRWILFQRNTVRRMLGFLKPSSREVLLNPGFVLDLGLMTVKMKNVTDHDHLESVLPDSASASFYSGTTKDFGSS